MELVIIVKRVGINHVRVFPSPSVVS